MSKSKKKPTIDFEMFDNQRWLCIGARLSQTPRPVPNAPVPLPAPATLNGFGFLEGPCDPSQQSNNVTITRSDEVTEMCLLVPEGQPMAWRWAADESRFAYALPTGELQAPLSGRYGFNRPPAIQWFITDTELKNPFHFPKADR